MAPKPDAPEAPPALDDTADTGRHPFDRWLWERRISVRKAARGLGVSHTHLQKALRGEAVLADDIKALVAEQTGGDIAVDSWPPARKAR